MAKEPSPTLSANKQALLRIRELKQQLELAQQETLNAPTEPIAIVSMACRFPKRSQTPEQFWQCLIDKVDVVGEIPGDRWDLEAFFDEDPEVPGKMYARNGAFLDSVDEMDPEFFGISPREATWVDPQQRLLLEVGWEALERAGWRPEIIGEHTGIFVGWMHNDYQNEASDSFLNLNPYIATGAAGSFLCGRLAYYLGLEGPSIAVDTACSSSLVALHLACQSLQRRDCDRALVGGVNAICSPTTNILTCKLKALSPSGHSRAFDAAADGYLRGEGCGVVTLRRLSDATQDGDRVLGVIRGSAIGHNGFSSGLTAPNPKAQQKVIRQALERAGIEPREVAYLEAHGTGTELGDPLEMQAAAAALGAGRDAEHPLLVGSVKTNIGHLEAAAGMAGLIKVLLSLEHDEIPGQLNFETPNPHIDWERIPVQVLTEATPWPNSERRIAGVSAFGMSGTNAHVVVEASRPPKTPASAKEPAFASTTDQKGSTTATSPSPQLIPISGKSDEALHELAQSYLNYFEQRDDVDLAAVAQTAARGRVHFSHRAAIVAAERHQAEQAIRQFTRGVHADELFHGAHRSAPRIGWQFTGQGSQFLGMAQGVYQSEPVFRRAMDDCDMLLKQWREGSLLDVIFDHRTPPSIDNTHWTQPALFAVQMGLAQLLRSFGLQPHAVMGHSVGQYAAACVAGILSWEDGLRLIAERGRLIGALPSGGRMLAVFGSLERIESLVDEQTGVSVAAFNGSHVVVSGDDEAVAALEQRLTELQVRSKSLTTSHAFHSARMDPVLQPFAAFAGKFQFQPAELPLICNVSGAVLPAEQRLDGDYWAQHIRQPVRYADSVVAAQELGCDLLLELGPQSVLTRMAASRWRQEGDARAERLLSCLQRGVPDQIALKSTLASLYVQGAKLDFDAIYPERWPPLDTLPTYPFQRRRFWGPDKPRAFHAEFHTAHPLLGSPVALAGVKDEKRFEGYIEPDSPPWLSDHEVMGQVVLPGAAFIEMGLAASKSQGISNVVFKSPLQPSGRTPLQTVVRQGDAETIETFALPSEGSDWVSHFTANVLGSMPERPANVDRESLEAACDVAVDAADFYQKMHEIGLNYGADFQTITTLRHSQQEVLAFLETRTDIRGFIVPPPLLDGALHCLAVGLLQEDDGSLFLPVGVEAVHSYGAIADAAWCHAKWTQPQGKTRTADVTLFDDDGVVLLVLRNLRVQQMDRAVLRRLSGAGAERLLYDLKWTPQRLPAEKTANKRWLVVGGARQKRLSDSIAAALEAATCDVIRVVLQSSGLEQEETAFAIDPTEPAHWKKLLATLGDAANPVAGVAWILDDQTETGSPSKGLSDSTRQSCQGLMCMIKTLQSTGIPLECGLQLITSDAIVGGDELACDPEQSKYWGLGRVIGAERPDLRCRLIDVSSGDDATDASQAVADILLTETADSQWLVRGSQFLVPRMTQAKVSAADASADAAVIVKPDHSYLITGGLGMLGRLAAKWLAQKGAGQLILVSRSAPTDDALQSLAEIQSEGCEVIVHQADCGSGREVEALFAKFDTAWKPLAGLIHAAGVLDDGLLADQTWDRFEKVMTPKVIGSRLLHEHSKSLPLDFFILYSSAASVLGSPGQSNYATANAYLDGLAWQRRLAQLPAAVINWGPWAAGMADDPRIMKRLALQGITALAVDEAHQAMDKMLAGQIAQATVIDVDWRRMQLGLGGESPPMLQRLAPSRRKSQMTESALVSKLKRLPAIARKELLVKTVQESLQRILDTPEPPELDRPLIEMGLDSLMAVEFGAELQQMLGDQFAVGPTMLFDHPTVDAIAEHVLELVAGQGDGDSDTGSGDKPVSAAISEGADGHAARSREPIAIIGMSCRFPGAHSVDEFWQNILNQVDSVCEIPADRWDVDRFYSETREPGKMYTREGGFLEDIGEFDAEFFNVSPQEACWIDPQHRMLLENSYRALEDAGISPQPLADPNVGVFMGIMGQDYAFLPRLEDELIVRAFEGAGLSHSAGVGRISYVFGFEGPCVAVDTASSSSLVALLQAVVSLQDGNCNMALAGGVNAILAPVNSLLMSKAGLLAPDGRCKSFSAEADGFGRGEGCGVVVLKRLSDAERDGDRIMAVVRGGAVVHNGTSSGITAPNSKSQSRVITQALDDAKVAPTQVQYLEAHGTGTEFGDAMELGAAAAVYGKGRRRDNPLLVGSVKANISHLEAAGGISGLIKTVLAIHYGTIPPQAHFDAPSPHIPWKRMPLQIVTEPTAWPEAEQRIAGVTALGLVGTNAHVVLSSPPDRAKAPESLEATGPGAESDTAPERTPQLLTISARSPSALATLTADYIRYLANISDEDLPNVCYTAAVGRRHYEHRLALPVASVKETLDKLTACQVSKETGVPAPESNGQDAPDGQARTRRAEGVWHGVAASPPKNAWVFPSPSEATSSELWHAVRELYAFAPEFRQLMTEFDAHLVRSSIQLQLLPLLESEHAAADEGVREMLEASDLPLFLLQAGLATIWMAWVGDADGLAGVGVGQFVAASAAGALCIKDALLLVLKRSEAIASLSSEMEADARNEVFDAFESFADQFNFYPPNIPLICSLSGEVVPVHRSLGGSYWRRHLVTDADLETMLSSLRDFNAKTILEFGSPGWLAAQTGAHRLTQEGGVILNPQASDPSIGRGLISVLGQLYVRGAAINFDTMNQFWRRRRLRLPVHPFQKQRYWITEIGAHMNEANEVVEQ